MTDFTVQTAGLPGDRRIHIDGKSIIVDPGPLTRQEAIEAARTVLVLANAAVPQVSLTHAQIEALSSIVGGVLAAVTEGMQ